MLITRRVEFSSSHICRNPQLSEEENLRLYGPASNLHGHGHNYSLEVTLRGEVDPTTGMIYDLKDLKAVMMDEVVEPMDHRHLNHEVPPFDKVIPTTENIAVEIWRRMEKHFSEGPARLHSVRLFETEDTWVELTEAQ